MLKEGITLEKIVEFALNPDIILPDDVFPSRAWHIKKVGRRCLIGAEGVEDNSMRIRNNKALVKLIIAKSRQVCKTLKSEKRKRGRPPKYEDHLIVVALLRMIRQVAQERDCFSFCVNHNLPSKRISS